MTNENHIMKALRRLMLVPLIALGLLSIVATGGGGGGGSSGTSSGTRSSVPCDDVSMAMIDRTKWTDLEFVRCINNGALESALTRFGSNGSNGLNLVNPDSVTEVQADVTVTAVSNTNAEARARVIGDFYNDGTVGGGFVGDVLAGTEILHNGTSLVVTFFVVRCDDLDCVAFTELVFDDTTFGPVALGETHTLSVAWDGALFTFGFDGATTTFDPTAMAPVAGPAGPSRFKGIGTRVSEIAAPDEGAFIAARFDNVAVNGNPYDDFSAAMIDRTKWLNLEFVRRVNNGVLESAIRRFGINGANDLSFINPDTVNAIQADVTVTAVSNIAAEPRARVVGDFYDVGTPGSGFTGNVRASTRIRHNGAQLVGSFRVFVCGDSNCAGGFSVFFDDTTIGPVAVGETHTLSVEWDGTVFTFGFDGVTTIFDPTLTAPPVAPPGQAYKNIDTRVLNVSTPDEGAFIAARFDNVRVNGIPYEDF